MTKMSHFLQIRRDDPIALSFSPASSQDVVKCLQRQRHPNDKAE